MIRDAHIWLPAWIASRLRRRPLEHPVSILLAFADHFEPEQNPGDPPSLQLERVREWTARWEERYRRRADCLGRPPLHTYFFPEEQYRPEVVDQLAAHCARGFGEVEIHIHHDGDTAEGFRRKIETFKERLASHRLLSRERGGAAAVRPGAGATAPGGSGVRYAFVHGNWALDNARRDGRWCGLNDEITLLRETGCYADFTLPCTPAEGQTRTVNSIYFADDDPKRPKSHDAGRAVSFGGRGSGDLLMIQGPLGLNWRMRTRGLFPRVENGDVTNENPITRGRIMAWIDERIGVAGRPDAVFVKLHTHGLKPRNMPSLLGDDLERGFRALEKEWNDGARFRLYYVTAREMANVVYAWNDGVEKSVPELLDYRFVPLMRD